MAGELWWVPSVIVFAGVVVVIAVLAAAARTTARRRRNRESAAAADRARAAAISLVRADDAVQAGADELDFAVAQFGEPATREFAEAVALSRRQLRDAFALQQKLDDAEADTEAQRRRWNEQIVALADEATQRLARHIRTFDARRVDERDAPFRLDQLGRRIAHAQRRVADGDASLDRLRVTYAESALAPISGNANRARAELERAGTAAQVASGLLAGGDGQPVVETIREAEEALFRAAQLLDAIEAGEDRLHVGLAALGGVLSAADAELIEARELRDQHEDAAARAELNAVITRADGVVAELRRPSRLSDPAADLTALRTAMDGLDVIRSEARNRQLRAENARGALPGALLAAQSQISVTRDFINAHRARVGAAARTRLAEAERQLTLARAEGDPVVALDTARRAMTHATDADALARYDTH